VHERNRTTDLLVATGTEPSGLRGWIASDPGTDRLDHKDVREPCDDRLAARPQLAGLGGHEAKRALNPFDLR